jgi:hypothetical protein
MISKTRGRPKGWRKENAASKRDSIRLTAEQKEWLQKKPGMNLSERLRRWIDTCISEEREQNRVSVK